MRKYSKPLKTAEEQLRGKLEKEGWEVLHYGWPDFACVKGDEMMFVEVKSHRGEMLKSEQHFILTHLAKLGLNCFKWIPDTGFERITPTTPLPIIEETGKKKRGRLTEEERWNRLSPEEQKYAKQLESAGKVYFY